MNFRILTDLLSLVMHAAISYYLFTQTVNINRVESCMHNKYDGLS